MWRYLVGLAAGVLLVAGGLLWWKSTALARHTLPDAPQAAAGGTGETLPDLPMASEKTREERRLARIDHDKNGQVSRDEFLAARRRNFARLDADGDGKLSFEEYATKGIERFAEADKDKTGALTAAEFATTRVARKASTTRCPPAGRSADQDEG